MSILIKVSVNISNVKYFVFNVEVAYFDTINRLLHNNIFRAFSTSEKCKNLFFLVSQVWPRKKMTEIIMIFQRIEDGQSMWIKECQILVVIYLSNFRSQIYSRKIQLVEIVIGCFVTSYKKVLMFYGRFLTNFHELNAINVLWHSYAFDIVCTNLIVRFFLFWKKIYGKINWHSLMNSIYRNER